MNVLHGRWPLKAWRRWRLMRQYKRWVASVQADGWETR